MISVIVPVYNMEAYLEECIESVLDQTYSEYELLLVDDASTDESPAICDKYAEKDARIRVFHKLENGGASSARNMGLDNATGEYVCFLDADDCLTSDCLEVLLKGITEHDADISYGRTVRNPYPWNSESNYEVWSGLKGLEESLKDNPFLYSACGKLYRRDFIGDTRFNDRYRVNEDTFFIFQLLCKKPTFVCLSSQIYQIGINPISATRAPFTEKFFDVIAVSEEKYAIIKQEYPSLLMLAENMRLKAKMNLLRILAIKTTGEFVQKEKELEADIIRNAQYYQSGIPSDDRWMFIIKHHLYPLYTLVKRKIKKN